MSHQINKLNVIYRGRRTTLYYWARGNGGHFPGYVTSLHQIQTALCHVFGCVGLELHCIYKRHMHELRTDESLQRALRYSGGASLSIHAYDERSFTSTWNFGQVHQDAPVYVPSGSSYVNFSTCYHCRRSPYNGSTYEYAGNSRYKLCGTCYRKLDFWNKKNWKKQGTHTIACTVVPQAPLHRDISSVRQLQNILVNLGYLRRSDTVGSYKDIVSRTEDGVVIFRRKYRIFGKDMREYDVRTARKLAEVVKSWSTGHL